MLIVKELKIYNKKYPDSILFGGVKMAYIKEYWINKENRAEQARKHTKEMEEKYYANIAKSIKNTKIYDTDYKFYKPVEEKDTTITVEDLDTVSAIIKYGQCGKVATLNFSSYKNPGGMFFNGSKAQEECLCHESYLYNVLSSLVDEFYAWNNKHKNKALYLNRGLYSPDILFIRGRDGEGFNDADCYKQYCDVITCAAPNKSTAQKYQSISDAKNTEVLRDRIRFVLDIAKSNNVDTLILGAYGCGVFGQDPTEVASIFKEYLYTTYKCFDRVVFAIPKGNNLDAFKEVFKK